MKGFIIIMTSVDSKSEANRMAMLIMKKRLAGCTKVTGPVKSYYTWKGKQHASKEWICIIKTKKANYKKIEKELKKTHKYELPEIISFNMGISSPEYLKWLDSSMI